MVNLTCGYRWGIYTDKSLLSGNCIRKVTFFTAETILWLISLLTDRDPKACFLRIPRKPLLALPSSQQLSPSKVSSRHQDGPGNALKK